MTEEKVYGVSVKGMRAALRDTLLDIGKNNEKVVVIDCETGTATNVIQFKREIPERYVSLGVAEQNAISFAFGVSSMGLIPVVPLFGAFLTRRACDQIFIQAGYAEANIKMIGCYSGLTTPNTGATHQSVNDLSIMRSIPKMIVVEVCDENELNQAISAAIEHNGPIYIRMARGDIEPYDSQPVMPEGYRFAFAKATVLKQGSDVTLIGSGVMVSRCMEAAEALGKQKISAEVINCSSIKPLDEKTVLDSARKTGAVITAENHSIIGGLGSAVVELLAERCPVLVKRIGIMDKFGESGPLEDLFTEYGLTTQAVANVAKQVVGYKPEKANLYNLQ